MLFFALDLTGAQPCKSKRRGLLAACVLTVHRERIHTQAKSCSIVFSYTQLNKRHPSKRKNQFPSARFFAVERRRVCAKCAHRKCHRTDIILQPLASSISSGLILNNNSAVSERRALTPKLAPLYRVELCGACFAVSCYFLHAHQLQCQYWRLVQKMVMRGTFLTGKIHMIIIFFYINLPS